MRTVTVRWAPFVLCLLLIALLTLLPGRDIPPLPPWRYADKFAHATAWTALGAATWWALAMRRHVRRVAWLAWFTALGYGVFIELAQWFVPGRDCEFFDVVADALGAAIGVGLMVAWARWRERAARPAD